MDGVVVDEAAEVEEELATDCFASYWPGTRRIW